MNNTSVLVIFGEALPRKQLQARRYDVVVAKRPLRQDIENLGFKWVDIDSLIEPGSIYEASTLLEELSRLTLPDGTRISKSFVYKGFELWWINYDSLFFFFCLPYTQNRKLLEYIKEFDDIYVYEPTHRSLFSCYLNAHGRRMFILRKGGIKSPSFLPFGMLLQILLTVLFIPALALMRRPTLVYTGDKFEKGKDHDFRMRFIYEALRRKNMPFVEFVRGVESWKSVLGHALVRKRPVVYPEAIVFVGRFLSILLGGHRRARREFGAHIVASETDALKRFKLLIATQYLLTAYDDVWVIRIMKWILPAIGVKVAIIPGASRRSFHTVLACKLNNIPSVGILHGVASRHYNVYEFMPGFNGKKSMTLDKYGVWSEWWREYFIQHSSAYTAEQLYVSGPMRPLLAKGGSKGESRQQQGRSLQVLFVSEEMAVPQEVLPYLLELLRHKDLNVTLKFRPQRDGFEQWLQRHEPKLLDRKELQVVKGSMQDAIENTDVAVGCQSTGVLEALLQHRVPIYFRTRKWGDYYSLKGYDKQNSFFAETPEELVKKIRQNRFVAMDSIRTLRERYFGDPYLNGSEWVVEQAEQVLLSG